MTERSTERGLGLFTLIWFGQVISNLGTGLTGFALGVKVFQETGSITRFALIGLSVVVPGLLLSPLAGVLADRLDRRKILIFCNVGAAAANLLLYGLIRSGRLELWHIYPVILISSSCMAFVWPTFAAAITVLVDKAHYARASGMNQMGGSVAQVLAPVLAGLLLEPLGLGGIVLINFASYLFAACVLLMVRFPRPAESEEGRRARGTVRQQTGHGWAFIRERPGLLRLLLLFAGLNFTVGLLTVLLTPLVLGFASPRTLGLVLTVASSGTLVGSLWMSVWGGPERRVRLVLKIVLAMGGLALLIGLQPSATLIALVAFLFMAGFPIATGAAQAIWQSKVPADLQGRVFAVRRMVAGLSSPLALVIAGPLTDFFFEPWMQPGGLLASSAGRLLGTGPGRGIALLMMVAGALLWIVALLASASRSLRTLEADLPDAEESGAAAETSRRGGRRETFAGAGRAQAGVLLTVLAMAVALAVWTSRPPRPLPATAAPEAFSADRALQHLDSIADRPRPTGSTAAAEVRDYLAEQLESLGLEVEVQNAAATREVSALGLSQKVRVENVVGRLAGQSREGAVLLVAHYDSGVNTNGASDNGAAVSSLLETARALRASGEILARDVLFLFTDAEEIGLHGARWFARTHPWAANVGVVVNFEARGRGGPVILFQVGAEAGTWVPRLARAVSEPRGSSVFGEVYRRLPNDTDFTVFQEVGWAGFNLAWIEGLSHYHSRLDQIDTVSAASVQHQGTYALELARGLASIAPDAEPGNGSTPAYFDLLGRWMVWYPSALGYPLLLLALVGLGVALRAGFAQRLLTPLGIAQGFLSLFGSLVTIPVVISLLWLALRDGLGIPVLLGGTGADGLFLAAFATLGLVLWLRLETFSRTFASGLDLTAGALLAWALLALLFSGIWFPVEAQYLVVWPLLAALPAFLLLCRARASAVPLVASLALGAVVVLVLWVPSLVAFFFGLQSLAEVSGVALLPGILVAGLLRPHFELITSRLRALGPIVLVLGVGLLLLAARQGAAGPDGSGERLRTSSVLYAYDADQDHASWFSYDALPSPWGQSFGLQQGQRESFHTFLPPARRDWLVAEAPVVALPAPEVQLVARNPSGGREEVELLLRAGEGAVARLLWLEPASEALSLDIAGTAVALPATESGRPWIVQEIPIEAREQRIFARGRGNEPLRLVVVEQHEGLPDLAGISTRPSNELTRPFLSVTRSDVSLVRRSFSLSSN